MERDIQRAERWESDAYNAYTVINPEDSRMVSRILGGKVPFWELSHLLRKVINGLRRDKERQWLPFGGKREKTDVKAEGQNN